MRYFFFGGIKARAGTLFGISMGGGIERAIKCLNESQLVRRNEKSMHYPRFVGLSRYSLLFLIQTLIQLLEPKLISVRLQTKTID